jgi:hypothetical protein
MDFHKNAMRLLLWFLKGRQNNGVHHDREDGSNDPRLDAAHAPDDGAPEGVLFIEFAAAARVPQFDCVALAG